ncbi:MAG: DUF1189 family protein [Lentisphaeria bacterium]
MNVIPEDTSKKHSSSASGSVSFSLRQILQILFFYPHKLLLLLQANWRRALVRMVLISFVCGVLSGLSQVVGLADGVFAWGDWLEENVDALEISDGKLIWQKPANLPATDYFRGWRLDFKANAEKGFDPADPPGTATRGVWVSPEKSFIWWRIQKHQEARVKMLFAEGKLFGNLEPSALGMSPSVPLSGTELKNTARQMLWFFVPMYLLFQGVWVVFQVLLYVAIFSFIPLVMKSPLVAGGFRSVFTFYLYTGLPAVLVATVYTLAGIRSPDFGTIFLTAFVAYLILAMWRVGKAMRTGY